MNNLPEGVYSWELDVPEHLSNCESNEGKECNCDETEIAMVEEEANVRAEEGRGN